MKVRFGTVSTACCLVLWWDCQAHHACTPTAGAGAVGWGTCPRRGTEAVEAQACAWCQTHTGDTHSANPLLVSCHPLLFASRMPFWFMLHPDHLQRYMYLGMWEYVMRASSPLESLLAHAWLSHAGGSLRYLARHAFSAALHKAAC